MGERELAAFLRAQGFPEAKRGQQFKGSPESPDILGLPGHHVECKRVEALSLYDAVGQAQRDAGPTDIPIVCHRRNGKPHHPLPWVAILTLENYLSVWREAQAWREFTGEIDAVC